MTAHSLAVDALLAAGVAAQWVCSLGVLLMRGPYNRLHYAGAGATLGPVLVATAALLHFGWTASGYQTVVVAALLVLSGPMSTMALARAARRTDTGSVEPAPEERVGP